SWEFQLSCLRWVSLSNFNFVEVRKSEPLRKRLRLRRLGLAVSLRETSLGPSRMPKSQAVEISALLDPFGLQDFFSAARPC
ncbi:MAG: hypothetical protein AAB316_07780, partial [Bacteroidota bacterium]